MASEALILVIGTLPWLLPLPLLGIALAGAALRIGYESGVVNGMPKAHSSGMIGAGILAGFSALVWFQSSEVWPLGLAVLILATGGAAILANGLEKAWLWRFLIYPVLPFMLFVFSARWANAAFACLLSFLLVEIFDSFSLLGGRLFGKRLLVPKLSPQKTWEGLAVGFLAVAISAISLAALLKIDLPTMAAVAIAVTAGALIGDLFASAAKRRAGVKDYPPVLPIQGGLLDIMDAWIVAGPLAGVIFTALH